jgi:hypothetical protein
MKSDLHDFLYDLIHILYGLELGGGGFCSAPFDTKTTVTELARYRENALGNTSRVLREVVLAPSVFVVMERRRTAEYLRGEA